MSRQPFNRSVLRHWPYATNRANSGMNVWGKLSGPPCSPATAARTATQNQGRPSWQWIHGGYPVSPHAPIVQQRLARGITELTEQLQSDLIFEDQVGAGDVHCELATGDCRDYSQWIPHPTAYRQGWLDHTARYTDVGLMTEVGYDRMAAYELGFHGSLLFFERQGMADIWWGKGNWRPYPLATMLLRDKVLFYQHNLAPETFTDNLSTLRWNLAMGYQLSYGLNVVNGRGGPNNPWLDVASLFQRVVLAPHATERLTAFTQVADQVTATEYGPIRVVANWHSTRPHTIAEHKIVPDGFYLTDQTGVLVAGAFTTYNGVALSPGGTSSGGRTHTDSDHSPPAAG